MAYCTKQDMIDRFSEQELIQLTDINGLALIDDVVLNQAISDAEAEINGYLAKYTLPLVTVPPVLVRLSCDIARYFLYDDMATDQVIKRFDAALKYLLSVAKGQVALIQTDNPSAGQNLAQMQSEGNVFGRNSLY